MKTHFKTLLAIGLLTFPLVIFAQTEKNGFNLNKKYAPGAAASYDVSSQFDIKYRNDIPIRALRNFINHYKEVNNLHWYTMGDGFIAQFITDAAAIRVEFDAKGFWCQTISNFTEEQTPKAIRDRVKEVYNDFHIFIAHQIETNTALWYIIKIENETKLKTLQIKDGAMEVTDDYVKG